MGCICAGESDIEHFLTDFIDELKVRKYTDVKYFSHLEKNRPFYAIRTNYDEFLRANQNEVHHTNYQTLLFNRPHYLFYISLIFLVQSDPLKMANNYRSILDQLRQSQNETRAELLEDLTKDNYDTLYDVLAFYARMVSLDIVEAAEKSKENRITEDQMKVLKNNYSLIVIDYFVKDLMRDCANPNTNIDEFFKKNFMNLKHNLVRERLRKIYENMDHYVKTLKHIPKNGTEVQNLYVPKVEVQVEEELVCCENENDDIEMLRLREEEEKFRLLSYNNYRRECLFHHNRVRALHGVPALRESDSLSEYSQQWATFIAETDHLTHSSMIWDGKVVGENIAKAGAILNDPSQLIVNKWYEEKNNYDFSIASSQNNTKNFTQMVWRETESIGFGLAHSKTGNTFIVINYYPPGNCPETYRENVNLPRYKD
jgi:hypothetical protein